MGGAKLARKSIGRIYGDSTSWANAAAEYRVVVFGKGQDYDTAKPDRAVDPAKAGEVMNSGGKVGREEALRCRVRYFTDGAVLGSKEFVQSYFLDHRKQFGPKRRDGPREMRGSGWGDLTCLRDLRREVFGSSCWRARTTSV